MPNVINPTRNIIDKGTSVVSTVIKIIETRLALITLELEEEKIRIFKILLFVGISLLLLNFGLMSLMILIMWAVQPEQRIFILYVTTSALFLLSVMIGLCAVRYLKKSTLLKQTRDQIKFDINTLRGGR